MGGYRRFCVQCGSEMKRDARFCANCGHTVTDGPQRAGTGENERATRTLPVPPPTAGWNGPAVPPDGGLFPSPSGLPPQDTPFRADSASFPPGSIGYPRRDAIQPAAPGHPPPPGPAAGSTDRALPAPLPAPTVATRSAGSPPGEGGYPQTGTETAQFSQTWINDVGFSPQWEPGPLDGEEALPGGERQRSPKLLAGGLFALVAAVVVVPALLIAHSFPSITGGGAAPQPTATQPARGGTAAAPTRRSAAASLAALLAQTATDRSSIVTAVGSVEHCTAALRQAPLVFQNSAASRQRLLQQLAALPGSAALPASMLQALAGAWQASATVDADLAKWAQDEAAQGCAPDDHADANYQAASAPDSQATADKTSFAGMWDAIAAEYGLPRYQTSQL